MCGGKSSPFFQEPCYSIQYEPPKTQYQPTIKVNVDDETSIALYLARAGYYGGNPENVFNANGTLVIQAYQFELFCRNYETAVIDMQQKEQK